MHPVAEPRSGVRGRWIWGLSGLATIVVLGIPGARLITGAGSPVGGPPPVTAVPSRVVTVRQPVTSVNVESYGSNISVVSGSGLDTRVAESITYGEPDAGPPAVTVSVSDGRLTLAAPSCAVSNCSVGFTVTVPAGVAVTATSDGGPVDVSGVARATIGSAGGPVRATGIRGPLAVQTGGGSLVLDGIGGPLRADTGGGPLLGRDVAAAMTTVTTDGGDADLAFTGSAGVTAAVSTAGGGAQLQFTAAPRSVVVSTDGGAAFVSVPGGPYALTTDSDGGPQLVGIATSPAAHSSIVVTSGGGPLQIEPATGRAAPKVPIPQIPAPPPAPKV
jgi:hypothetical protein